MRRRPCHWAGLCIHTPLQPPWVRGSPTVLWTRWVRPAKRGQRHRPGLAPRPSEPQSWFCCHPPKVLDRAEEAIPRRPVPGRHAAHHPRGILHTNPPPAHQFVGPADGVPPGAPRDPHQDAPRVGLCALAFFLVVTVDEKHQQKECESPDAAVRAARRHTHAGAAERVRGPAGRRPGRHHSAPTRLPFLEEELCCPPFTPDTQRFSDGLLRWLRAVQGTVHHLVLGLCAGSRRREQPRDHGPHDTCLVGDFLTQVPPKGFAGGRGLTRDSRIHIRWGYVSVYRPQSDQGGCPGLLLLGPLRTDDKKRMGGPVSG